MRITKERPVINLESTDKLGEGGSTLEKQMKRLYKAFRELS